MEGGSQLYGIHPSSLVNQLKPVLLDIHANPSPPVVQPPECKRRASVALVLRVRPQYPQKETVDPAIARKDASDSQSKLENFFNQKWVQTGEPEILFIKRASRVGDRWGGHVAFPGGKREPGDASDEAASVRETMEEVGLDLKGENCVQIGDLPQRVITTNWGKIPIMVLCPFVYLLLQPNVPPLSLQPAEVHSAHWVPLRWLLAPDLRTQERSDISDRLKPQRGPLAKHFIRATTGQLVFRATLLLPSESLYSMPAPEQTLKPGTEQNNKGNITSSAFLNSIYTLMAPLRTQTQPIIPPLRLWGLTLGIVSDLLEKIDVDEAATLWRWPTFSHLDIRLILWLSTRKLRKQLTTSTSEFGKPLATSGRANADGDVDEARNQGQIDGRESVKVNGMDGTTHTTTTEPVSTSTSTSITNVEGKPKPQVGLPAAELLDEYFRRMRRSVMIALILRANLAALVVGYLIWRRRRGGRWR